MGSIGAGELLVIFLVILLLFGAKRIPEIARGLGQGLREFRSATREIARELHAEEQVHSAPPRPAPVTASPSVQPPDVPAD